jgi:hypothetical protein
MRFRCSSRRMSHSSAMPWRYLAIRYAWTASVHEVLRSRRWSEDQKVEALFWIGAAASVPVTLSQVLWLFTGRGPIQWLFRPEVAFVNPYPRWRPNDHHGALARQAEARRRRYGDVPLFPH